MQIIEDLGKKRSGLFVKKTRSIFSKGQKNWQIHNVNSAMVFPVVKFVQLPIFYHSVRESNVQIVLSASKGPDWTQVIPVHREALAGLHPSFLSSPQDVLGGILVTAVLIVLTYPAWTLIDRLDSASPLFPVCVIVVPFFLCYNYPVSDCYSPTRADTTTILAAGAGVTLGFWINHFFQLVSAPAESLPVIQNIPPLTTDMVVLGLTKFVVGIVLILLVRQLVQNLSLQVLYSWFKVVTRNKEARRRLEIEVPYKFVTYTSVGICATTFVPMLHRFLGLL